MDSVADSMAGELDRQGEVIDRIAKRNDDIGDKVGHSDSILKYFGRAMLRDRLLLFLIFLCGLAIVGIIVVSILTKKTVVVTSTTASNTFEPIYIPVAANSTNTTNSTG